jgi:hypothetical protein
VSLRDFFFFEKYPQAITVLKHVGLYVNSNPEH